MAEDVGALAVARDEDVRSEDGVEARGGERGAAGRGRREEQRVLERGELDGAVAVRAEQRAHPRGAHARVRRERGAHVAAARDLEAPREVRQHREREREHARILVVCARRLRLCSVHGRCHRVQRARVTQLPCTVARERECRECTQQKEFQLCIAPVCARAIRGMHAVECSKHGAWS